MDQEKLNEILKKHKLWLEDKEGGEKADLRAADLRAADLMGADLRAADLMGADLRSVNLKAADLRSADLRSADLRGANLRGANLKAADLRDANLRDANLDFSCFPLWCGAKDMKVGIKLVRQLLAHIYALDCEDLEHGEIRSLILPYAQKSHRAQELKIL